MRITACILALLASALAGLGQTITGAEISTNGWQLILHVAGLNTNGTYSFGWATNRQPTGAEKVALAVTSPGYNSLGQTTSMTRFVFGTLQVRFPYPGQSFTAESTTGTGITIPMGLSDYVFSGDSGITLNLLSGLYSQGGSNTPSISGLAVTNGSLQAYPKVVANWSWPGYQRETGATMRLRAVGFAGQRPYPFEAVAGRPLAAMKFVATPSSGAAVTSVVSAMSIDRTLPDLLPTGEYLADIPLSGMTNGATIRCDFVAYPHIGDSNAVFDTTENLYTGATGLPKAITNLCDRLNTYSDSIAIVAPTGNDTNGTTTTTAGYPTHTNFFLTHAKAAHAIKTNNAGLFGHDDVGGGIVLTKNGSYNWLGGGFAYGNAPTANIIIADYPGDPGYTFTNASGFHDISDRIKIVGATFTGNNEPLSGTDYIWLDSCTISNTSTLGFIGSCPSTWLTHCRVQTCTGGLRPPSTQHNRYQIRGSNLDGFSGSIIPGTFIGNVHPQRVGAGNFTLNSDIAGSATSSDFGIWYNNVIAGLQNSGSCVAWGQNTNNGKGFAIVQNVFVITTNGSSAVFNFGTSALNHTNLILAHNAFVGKRVAGFGYNDTGTNAAWRVLWTFLGNLIENGGWKTDTHDTGSGNRVGNWPLMWGVGYRNNYHPSVNSSGAEAPGSFVPYWMGLSSYHPGDGQSLTNTIESIAFTMRASVGGTNGVEGIGNWRLLSRSGAFRVSHGHPAGLADFMVPWDLDGVYRGLSDPSGPYVSGNPRKSIFVGN